MLKSYQELTLKKKNKILKTASSLLKINGVCCVNKVKDKEAVRNHRFFVEMEI
jgi:hypothetical protein